MCWHTHTRACMHLHTVPTDEGELGELGGESLRAVFGEFLPEPRNNRKRDITPPPPPPSSLAFPLSGVFSLAPSVFLAFSLGLASALPLPEDSDRDRVDSERDLEDSEREREDGVPGVAPGFFSLSSLEKERFFTSLSRPVPLLLCFLAELGAADALFLLSLSGSLDFALVRFSAEWSRSRERCLSAVEREDFRSADEGLSRELRRSLSADEGLSCELCLSLSADDRLSCELRLSLSADDRLSCELRLSLSADDCLSREPCFSVDDRRSCLSADACLSLERLWWWWLDSLSRERDSRTEEEEEEAEEGRSDAESPELFRGGSSGDCPGRYGCGGGEERGGATCSWR